MKNKEYIAQLASKSVEELQKSVALLRDEARDLRFKASQNQLKAVRQLRLVKKNIARVASMLTARNTK